jgi:DNA invertase Pin-like site-specific DNA recombinase
VSELSRIGRSMLEIMEVLRICLEKGIHIHAIKGNWKLDNSIQSKVMAMVFTIASEIERDLISLRTKEALKAIKNKGMTLGRPKGKGKSKLDQYRPEIEAMLNIGATQKFIAKLYGTTEANFTNCMNKNGIYKPKIDLDSSKVYA